MVIIVSNFKKKLVRRVKSMAKECWKINDINVHSTYSYVVLDLYQSSFDDKDFEYLVALKHSLRASNFRVYPNGTIFEVFFFINNSEYEK